MINAIIFSLSLMAALAAVIRIREVFVKKITFLYYLAWHLPVFIAITFPFEIPIRLEPLVVFVMLGLVHLIVMPGLVINLRRLDHQAATGALRDKASVPGCFGGGRKILLRVVIIWAYLSVGFIFIDLYVIRGLGILPRDLSLNRDIFLETNPSLWGYLGLIGAAMALFLLAVAYDPAKGKVMIRRVIPYLGIAVLFLLLGNRQYLLFGLLLAVIQLSYWARMSFRRYLLVFVALCTAFSGIMLIYQFSRQTYSQGQQFEFLQKITKIQCTSEALSQHPRAQTLMAYLYVYYGIEYQAVSLITSIDRSEFHLPVTAFTVPIIYRRIYRLFRLGEPKEVDEQVRNYIEETTGMLPLFWISMYGAAYLEGGWAGMFLLAAALSLLNILLINRLLRDQGQYRYLQAAGFYAAMIYGIQSFAASDPIIFFLIIFLIFISGNRVRQKTPPPPAPAAEPA